MQRSRLFLVVVVGLVTLMVGVFPSAAGSSTGPEDYAGNAEDGPMVDLQHGGAEGHLPASSSNVELVGKLDNLTNVDGGISDVAAFGHYAYLGAYSSECAGLPGAQGTGVHVVDISNPANPQKVGFLASEANSYVSEGVHVLSVGHRQILLSNNETCDGDLPATSGFSMWDVTNPLAATKLGQFGDVTPEVDLQTYHTTHSVQGFTWNGRAYAVSTDNQDLADVDIFDITPAIDGTGPAVLAAEVGLEDWPGAQGPYANGETVFNHDIQQKVINGHNFLLVSYWDAGQVVLNIDNPAAPVFVGDSDFTSPDPQTGVRIPEGNAHQGYWSADGKYVLATDEDFSPTRTLCEITSGASAGLTGCEEFGFTKPLGSDAIEGPTVFGGSGCEADLNGNGVSDRAEVPAAASATTIVVFSRGGCFFSDKVRSGEDAGYTAVAIGQSHGGTRNGLLPDAYFCGSQGSEVLGTASAICIGHRAMHQLFDDPPAYAAPEGYAAGGDLPAIGTTGATLRAQGGLFDGWGYVHLLDGTDPNLREIDTYAVAESLDPAYAKGFGDLSVHEVKTDPRPHKNLAYFSYYSAGLRVTRFGDSGITEVGHYIAEGGNNFWGVFPHCTGRCGHGRQSIANRPLLLMSDRDSGLWIFRYTGGE